DVHLAAAGQVSAVRHLAAAGQIFAVRHPAGRPVDHLAAAGRASGSDFDFDSSYFLSNIGTKATQSRARLVAENNVQPVVLFQVQLELDVHRTCSLRI